MTLHITIPSSSLSQCTQNLAPLLKHYSSEITPETAIAERFGNTLKDNSDNGTALKNGSQPYYHWLSQLSLTVIELLVVVVNGQKPSITRYPQETAQDATCNPSIPQTPRGTPHCLAPCNFLAEKWTTEVIKVQIPSCITSRLSNK